jgi:hypothetical protein
LFGGREVAEVLVPADQYVKLSPAHFINQLKQAVPGTSTFGKRLMLCCAESVE